MWKNKKVFKKKKKRICIKLSNRNSCTVTFCKKFFNFSTDFLKDGNSTTFNKKFTIGSFSDRINTS